MSKWLSVKRTAVVATTGLIAVLVADQAAFSDDRGKPELVTPGMSQAEVEALMGPGSSTCWNYHRGAASFDATFVDGKLTRFEKSEPMPPHRSPPPNPMAFFDTGSTTLTPQAEQALEMVVQDYEAVRGSATVMIIACTDGSEAQSHGPDLSQRRGEAVKNRLVALGIPGDRIEVLARGDSAPLLIVPPGAAEPLNRRVEIWVQRI